MRHDKYKEYARFCFIFLVCFNIALPVFAKDIMRPPPEISTGIEAKTAAVGTDFMMVTANPLATKAGYKILEKGGSAADAAIAAQLVLGLVEPQSSGLGGGAFALYYDSASKTLHSYDGRETAPSLAGPFLFYKNGKPMDFKAAQLGGRAVGVPGMPMLLKDLHQLHGKQTWMELFDDAIDLAENGFQVTPRLEAMIAAHQDDLKRFPDTADYFFDDDGKPLRAGWTLMNAAYEETLREYQFYSTSRFYQGGIAAKIVDQVQNIKSNAGLLTMNDFRGYKTKKRQPVCGPYRTYIVCSMGEPSSGALTMLQILGMAEQFDLPTWGKDDPRSWHVLAQASHLAFADRAAYMADPDFVNTPNTALLDPVYIAQRSALIDQAKALESVAHGVPPLWDGPLYKQADDMDSPGTTHISAVDKAGNVVALTSSIESAFGSHIMVDGFLLNNQLTDFSFSPLGETLDDGTQPSVANMVEGGKRPRSSMSPTIVFDADGKPVLVIGSAGGSNIIGYVTQRIISALDWGVDIQAALDMPNMVAKGGAVEVETQIGLPVQKLEELGNIIEIKAKNSGLTAIMIDAETTTGAADPRREGLAMGQ